MTVSSIRVKVVRRPTLKLKVLPRFPANIAVGNFLTVTNNGGTYTFSVDYTLLGPGPISDPTTAFVAILDQTAGIYKEVSLASLLTSGLDADLQAIASLTGTGILARTAANTWVLRAVTGTASEITVTNGDGVAGNPALSLPAALTFTGKTVTGGTFNSGTFGGTATWNGNKIGLLYGGTNADLSATGGASQFLKQTSVGSAVTVGQPAFTDISGTVAATQLPNPSATTLGGVQSLAATASKWINAISTSGAPSATQPAFTDISGQATLAQFPTIGANTVLGSIAGGTPIALSTAQHTSLVNAFTTTLNGAVPNPGVVASKFLRDDGTWQAVAGAGTVTSVTGGNQAITTSGTIQTDSGLGIQNISLSASVAANILTVNVLDSFGATCTATSSARIQFRSATATSGVVTSNYITGALSISTFATGATLGSVSNAAFRFWVLAFDNAGTTVLALVNASNATNIFPLNETAVLSTTAISAAATSAGVAYTPNGTTLTSKAFRILGYIEYNAGLTTAGTYATAPTAIQLFGPGVRKPGEVIQTVFTSTNSATSTTSSTYTSTGVTANISPTAAPNLVRVEIYGVCEVDTTNKSVSVAIFRGSTRVSGGVGVFGSTAGILMSTIGLNYIDAPGTTSLTTYTAKVRNLDNITTVIFPTTGLTTDTPIGSMIVSEIMG